MGEYLTLLTQVKNYIYNGRYDAACQTLKNLLNSLNVDYNVAKTAADKEKTSKAIKRLLPALDELKKGIVTEVSAEVLKLDKYRLGMGSISAGIGGYGNNAPAPQQPPVNNPSPAPQQPPKSGEPANSGGIKPFIPGGKGNGRKFVGSNNMLMPLLLDDYIGQEKAKKSLRISIGAAKKTGRPLAHLLICSPYGLGKTTLANIIANEVQMPFFNVNATNLKDVRALSLYFSKIQDSGIVFIDEIHTLKKEVQTVLLSIMTDFAVSLIDDDGNEQRFDLPPFTLIGATTQAGELLKPFLNRFAVLELEDYTEEDKLILVKSKFDKMGYPVEEDAIGEISRRCRGVPRTIETYVKGVIDVAISRDEKVVTKETADEYFDIHEVDPLGLTKNDIKILRMLDEAKKPLALITLESKTSIQREDIEFRYEPYLIKLGFLDKTMQGRIITGKGMKYLHPDDDSDGASFNGGEGGEDDKPDIIPYVPDVPDDKGDITPDGDGEDVGGDFFDEEDSENAPFDSSDEEDIYGEDESVNEQSDEPSDDKDDGDDDI